MKFMWNQRSFELSKLYFLLSYKSYLNNQYKIGNIKLIYYIKQSNSVLDAVSLKKLKISATKLNSWNTLK